MTTAQLLVVQGRPAGKRLPFPEGEYVIGRGAECDVRPDSEWVSRQHCLLRVAQDGVFLRDLGSRNGTLINGRLVSGERRLDDGDRIQIGPLVFEVRLEVPQTAAEVKAASEHDTAPMIPALPERLTPAPETKPADEPSPG
jgi:pSer/pThr/pTyr-binding forkhead associated (FHA) protein